MVDLAHRPLPVFGHAVELTDVPDSDSSKASELRRLFKQDGLLVVRGLSLSEAGQIAFCRLFGPVPDSPSENFIASNVQKGAFPGNRDVVCQMYGPSLPRPYLAACLHAVEVDPEAVGTRFVSAFGGYERLPSDLRARIDGLKALHVRERVHDRPTRLTDLLEGDICTVHDVVRRDPDTGRPFLFVNQAWTAQVIGMDQAHGDALLAQIHEHFYDDACVYEHHWADGDLVLWDNITVQHSRGLAGEGRRTLQRVTITEYGYAEQYPSDAAAIASELNNTAMLAG